MRALRARLQSVLAAAYHGARRGTERMLHGLRRRRASARVAVIAPRSMLVVCHGNVCRSPYAAAALRRALPATLRERVRIDSAGFIGPGRGSPEVARYIAAARGIDLDDHRSKVLTTPLVADAALVVVMDARQGSALREAFRVPRRRILVLGDLDPRPIEDRTILDPWDREAEVFEACYARIDGCVAELARLVAAGPRAMREPLGVLAAG